jgi:uncharacterized membrane protein YeaQ/YmgE (transglycosylase-associated protein family)
MRSLLLWPVWRAIKPSPTKADPVFLFVIMGVIGLFLGQFVIFFFGLREYFERLPEFRFLFDFDAAYLGAFFVAAIIHFIKPM